VIVPLSPPSPTKASAGGLFATRFGANSTTKKFDQRFLIECSFLKIQLVDGSRSLIPLIKRTDFEMMSLVSSCQHFIYARLIIAGLLPNIRISLKCDATALRNEGMQL